jgi:hypothetical protein
MSEVEMSTNTFSVKAPYTSTTPLAAEIELQALPSLSEM